MRQVGMIIILSNTMAMVLIFFAMSFFTEEIMKKRQNSIREALSSLFTRDDRMIRKRNQANINSSKGVYKLYIMNLT